ncbi:Transposase Tnp1/En/Spm-like [Arabidopsis thaliana x Arabidopsis arenosa]|uniref:Transposase Tnp1/En/Spm-like n=1 Tax=Arabidopsis thaliana x Arabidopsis arenosa TaxID=1240361 RepID=A0A8T1XPS4_9BRAS|nr:Transposase Tnp1/En/Spm-like [Arabidopsis thaliana x Arabidopsis arenosa]
MLEALLPPLPSFISTSSKMAEHDAENARRDAEQQASQTQIANLERLVMYWKESNPSFAAFVASQPQPTAPATTPATNATATNATSTANAPATVTAQNNAEETIGETNPATAPTGTFAATPTPSSSFELFECLYPLNCGGAVVVLVIDELCILRVILNPRLEELQSEVQDLKNLVRDLAEKKSTGNMASESEVSNVSKGVRCQILDWFAPTDIVVGEGEFCCAEPQYKIGRVKVAWPADKLILDDGFDNQDESHNTDGSKDSRTDDQHDSYKILDWNRDEVIAEGVVWSTDQKELVNNIPIGPNAVVMQVYQVINPTAYLWRPSSEMYVMGDALNEKIAWPIDRIELLNINAQEEIRRKSSQSTTSNNTGTSKDAKKKCILLECNNSGRKVAEGRVCSTNPTDVVHHVPIGPNASKVWVEVSKIGSASVWRPNSEIQFISDAIGSIVAWPNDKLIFV